MKVIDSRFSFGGCGPVHQIDEASHHEFFTYRLKVID